MKVNVKKIILITLASLAGLLLLAALGWYIFLITQFNVYQDDQYKFSIKYPSAWKMVIHPTAKVDPHALVAVIFVRPKDTAMDLVQENFSVTIQPVPDDIDTLDAFTARIKKQMIGVFGKNMNLVEDKPLHWGWREGHQIAMQEIPPNHLKLVNAWVFRSSQVFILTYLGDANKYDKDSFFVNEMIRSLQLQ